MIQKEEGCERHNNWHVYRLFYIVRTLDRIHVLLLVSRYSFNIVRCNGVWDVWRVLGACHVPMVSALVCKGKAVAACPILYYRASIDLTRAGVRAARVRSLHVLA